MVAELMAGHSKPAALLRAGATLYKRVPGAPQDDNDAPGAHDLLACAKDGAPALDADGGRDHGLIRAALDDVAAGTAPASAAVAAPQQPASLAARQPAHLELTPQQDPGAPEGLPQQEPQAQDSAAAAPTPFAAQLRTSGSRRLTAERPSSGVVTRSSHSLTVQPPPPRPGTAVPGLAPHAEDSAPALLGGRAGAATPAAERSSATVTAAGGVRRTSAPAHHVRVSNSTGHGVAGAPPPQQQGGGTMGLFANSALAGLVDGRLLGMQNQNQVVAEDAAAVDDTTCVICFDRESSCVFLECGHGGFCAPCARLLFVRPPNECPSCRRHVTMVSVLYSRGLHRDLHARAWLVRVARLIVLRPHTPALVLSGGGAGEPRASRPDRQGQAVAHRIRSGACRGGSTWLYKARAARKTVARKESACDRCFSVRLQRTMLPQRRRPAPT